MKTKLLLMVSLFAGIVSAAPLKIVCIGDSLTACGGPGGHYTDYLAQRLPDCEVINKGIGGDTLGGGRKRFGTDVLNLKPDVVVIELGANDFWRAKRPIEGLSADLEYMIRSAKESGAQVVIASCFGDVETGDPSPEFQEDLHVRYARGIARFERELCSRYGCFYVPNMQIDIKPREDHPEFWDDTNHPNKAGNEPVARRILAELEKALNVLRR
jgi:acyl-CoA thioesterase-1